MKKELMTFWDGGAIKVGERYDPKNVSILLFEDDEWKQFLTENDCQFSSFIVEKVGINWYTVIYSENGERYESRFGIVGKQEFISNDYPLEIYVMVDGNKLDLTESFRPWFYTDDFGYSISWNTFLNVVRTNNFGDNDYYLTAPKKSGVYQKYATEWIINISDDQSTLKSMIQKIHSEEEDENEESVDTSS